MEPDKKITEDEFKILIEKFIDDVGNNIINEKYYSGINFMTFTITLKK